MDRLRPLILSWYAMVMMTNQINLSNEEQKLLTYRLRTMEKRQKGVGVGEFRLALPHAGLEPWHLYSADYIRDRVLRVLEYVATTSNPPIALRRNNNSANKALKSCVRNGLFAVVDRHGTYRYTPEGSGPCDLPVPGSFEMTVYDELLACYARSENDKTGSGNMQVGAQAFKRALPYAGFDVAGETDGLYDRREILDLVMSVLKRYGCKDRDPQLIASPFKKYGQVVFERLHSSQGVYRFLGIERDMWHEDQPDRQFGEGSHGVVYAWCNPKDLTNIGSFPLKIGRTRQAVRKGRIPGTDIPHDPYVLALIRCGNDEELRTREKRLQEANRERQIEGRREWFETSKDALFSTIRTSFPGLAEIVRVTRPS